MLWPQAWWAPAPAADGGGGGAQLAVLCFPRVFEGMATFARARLPGCVLPRAIAAAEAGDGAAASSTRSAAREPPSNRTCAAVARLYAQDVALWRTHCSGGRALA